MSDRATKITAKLLNEKDELIDVQHPLATNGDSVYVKDIDLLNSDNGNFSGSVTDYFDSLKSINTDITANNPKIIKLWFNRTIYSHSIGFGCDDLTKGFGTSITIKLLGSGESVRFTKTFTSTDPNSFLAEFGPKAFNGVILEFNTASEVCLSNLTIAKSTETSATLNGTDPNGDTRQVIVTEDGNLSISDNSSGLAIAKGEVTGSTFVHKFGNAPDFDATDGIITVWDGAEDGTAWEKMVYTYSSTADIDSLSSSDNGDTQDIEVQGLDTNYDEVTQTITLTGQTPVSLTTNLVRVSRMINQNSTDNAGHIFCYVSGGTVTLGVPQVAADIRAVMQPLNNQTLMAVYTVPNGKTAYMRSWYGAIAAANKTSNYILDTRARNFGRVFQLKHRSSLSDNGSSYIQHNYIEPLVFPAKTDLEMRVSVTATGVTGASFSAGFDIVLVDN